MNNRLFLTHDEVAELSGIKAGRKGLSRDQRQIAWLRNSGIPFFVNAAGRPIITTASLIISNRDEQPKASWKPRVLSHTR
ncbi:DUF4224 domain-containing protein [Chitinimonas sp. PSY-7]|uniref:DUF4224 domain-containing protein n=1 Tax=Chitinimonas sp. PSY-7 TaxID=3459088 RepID=UPI0040402EC2